jgi:hypothetical protein
MMRFTYDPELIEEVVLLWERTAMPAERGKFRRERDGVYEIADGERREASFKTLHQRWFVRLAFGASVERLVNEPSEIAGRVRTVRVLRALTRREECADIVDHFVPTGPQPLLLLRLRPQTLLDSAAVTRLLRHELMHVTDMLDPRFGYERALPSSDGGPSADNIVRDRYRVLWDVTIDGRLARMGLIDPAVRQKRLQEFAAAFPVLGEACAAAFDEWFGGSEPTHERLMAFAQAPTGSAVDGESGRCPLCRFPVASLDPRIDDLSPSARAAIEHDYPSWRMAHGLCSQCFDLYEARVGQCSGGGRPIIHLPARIASGHRRGETGGRR